MCDKPHVDMAHTLTNSRDIQQDEKPHPFLLFAESQRGQVTGPESHCLGYSGTLEYTSGHWAPWEPPASPQV